MTSYPPRRLFSRCGKQHGLRLAGWMSYQDIGSSAGIVETDVKHIMGVGVVHDFRGLIIGNGSLVVVAGLFLRFHFAVEEARPHTALETNNADTTI